MNGQLTQPTKIATVPIPRLLDRRTQATARSERGGARGSDGGALPDHEGHLQMQALQL